MQALVYLLQVILVASVRCEMFTSIEHLANNLLAEETLVNILEALITSEQVRLKDLKLKLDYFKAKNAEAADSESYLANPINAFQLVKRLTLDLADVEAMAAQNGYLTFAANIAGLHQKLLPTEEDLAGARAALVRLQDTYDLETSDFSEGLINGVQYNVSLTVEDCLEIGKQAYIEGDLYHAILWLQAAFRRCQSECKLKKTIFQLLTASLNKTGHVEAANEFTEIDRRNFVSDVEIYEHTRMYELLCQGKTENPSLHCHYLDDRSAFLKIAPLKVEEVHLNPDILLFHEIISDSEIDEIKQLAKQKLLRATVSDQGGFNKPAVYRISKSGWLSDSEHKRVRTLSRRVEDMTGMTVATAEELQVVNYGIGGQYIPHYDENPVVDGYSNAGLGYRVSTVMFYMSGVEQGGATVFSLLNIGVLPQKGTAVFWYNLHKTGEVDLRTLHAGCPVLVGNKWVCNKWQHLEGQERKRPCDLQPDSPPLNTST